MSNYSEKVSLSPSLVDIFLITMKNNLLVCWAAPENWKTTYCNVTRCTICRETWKKISWISQISTAACTELIGSKVRDWRSRPTEMCPRRLSLHFSLLDDVLFIRELLEGPLEGNTLHLGRSSLEEEDEEWMKRKRGERNSGLFVAVSVGCLVGLLPPDNIILPSSFARLRSVGRRHRQQRAHTSVQQVRARTLCQVFPYIL